MEKIKNVGETNTISFLTNGEGIIKTKQFLSNLTIGFAKKVSDYMYKCWDAPFMYRERQLHTFFVPVLSQLSEIFLMESPVERKWSSISNEQYNDAHGWFDYYCFYRNIVFLMEIKHGFLSGKTGKVNKNLKDNWYNAIEQLDVIKDYANYESQESGGVFRIALQVIPIYEVANNGISKIVGDSERLLTIQKTCMEEFIIGSGWSMWSMLWKLHENLSGPFEYTNGIEFYPGIIFIAGVSEIHQ